MNIQSSFTVKKLSVTTKHFAGLCIYRLCAMNHNFTLPNQNSLVSKILQVALGLFVTTSELPSLPENHDQLLYDCSFDTPCRWLTVGNNVDQWRIGKGEPDSLLWLAATGTMQTPREPFALIECRGNTVDSLSTDTIHCQTGAAILTFNYWVIGNADIEVCLANEFGVKFNCTGMLNSTVMPGKVLLKIPELQNPYKIMIQPKSDAGVILLDDIHYDITICRSKLTSNLNRGRPDFMTTIPPKKIKPWTVENKLVTTLSTTQKIKSSRNSEPNKSSTKKTIEVTESEIESSFDIFIFGNKTKPLKNGRIGNTVEDPAELLCDFNNKFACRWGPEAGRWAIIEKGAVPSLEESIADPLMLPTYPAALVLQGTTVLASDPIQCQSEASKLVFRYWSNGDVHLQVCALGHGQENNFTYCVEQANISRLEKQVLAVFNIDKPIMTEFTINIVPQWSIGVKNRFLVLDEIAYLGQCVHHKPTTKQTSAISNSTKRKEDGYDLMVSTITESTTSGPVKTENYSKLSKLGLTKQSTTLIPRTPTQYTKNSRNIKTTFAPVFPEDEEFFFTTNSPTTKKTSSWISSPSTAKQEDYCDILNCNFDDNACNYLNHGLTKKPWTLRSRGYGFPLTGATDIRTTQSNGQFISAMLSPGDIAILESPKFNATQSLNVLLFQYFRPSQLTTIRLCLGSEYTNSIRSMYSFLQCPSILRSVTAKNAYRWNTVHVQLPPGTTHFHLVAQSSEKSGVQAAIALDNLRVAICDTKGFAPDYIDETTDFYV